MSSRSASPDEDAALSVASRALSEWYGIELPAYQRRALLAELQRIAAPREPMHAVDRLLARDASAWTRVVDAIAVSETYFFRHRAHFDRLLALARQRALGGRGIRVLSAGCASGEEAWSAAAVLDRVARETGYRGEVVGWDVNPRRLAEAEQRLYRDWSVRAGLHGYEERFLRRRDHWEVDPALSPYVRFAEVNLVASWPTAPELFDAIFFRNVAIYWDPATVARVCVRLAERVVEGGVLLVGPSDPTVLDPAQWSHVVHDAARVYEKQRTAGAVAARPPSRTPPPRPPRERLAAVRPPSPSTAITAAVSWSDEVRQLADAGAYQRALEIVRAQGGESVDARSWEGILLMSLDDPDAAIRAFRECLYLEPESESMRHWLALAYASAGRSADAERERRNAREIAERGGAE